MRRDLKFFLFATVAILSFSYFIHGTSTTTPAAQESREPVISTEVAQILARLRANHPKCISSLNEHKGQPISIRVDYVPNGESNFGRFDRILTLTYDAIFHSRERVVRFVLRNEANGTIQIVGSTGESVPANYGCKWLS